MKSSSAGRKKSTSLPLETVEYLKEWMMSPEHIAHPYPTEAEKAQIMEETGIELKQLTNWFVNNRKRYWKPRVEAKLKHLSASPTSGRGYQSKKKSSIASGTSSRPTRQPSTRPARAASSRVSAYIEHDDASSVEGDGDYDGEEMEVNHRESRGDSHTVSDGSAMANNCDDDGDDGDDSSNDASEGRSSAAQLTQLPVPRGTPVSGYVRREEVDLHVLRPEGTVKGKHEPLPTIRDLTIRSSVPEERTILATFRAPIEYTVPYDMNDRKKIQTRRDGEVLRLKKHYLKLYLATQGIHSSATPAEDGNVNTAASVVSSCSSSSVVSQDKLVNKPNDPSLVSPPNEPATIATLRKRAFSAPNLKELEEASSQRKRARTESRLGTQGDEEWRALCANAKALNCESLPGLEEAALLFGFVTSHY